MADSTRRSRGSSRWSAHQLATDCDGAHQHLGQQAECPRRARARVLAAGRTPGLRGDHAGHQGGDLRRPSGRARPPPRGRRPRGTGCARRPGAPRRSAKNASRPVSSRSSLPSTPATAAARRSESSRGVRLEQVGVQLLLGGEVLVDERLRHARPRVRCRRSTRRGSRAAEKTARAASRIAARRSSAVEPAAVLGGDPLVMSG